MVCHLLAVGVNPRIYGIIFGRRNGIFVMYIEIAHYIHPSLIELSANRQQAGDIQPKNQLIPAIT